MNRREAILGVGGSLILASAASSANADDKVALPLPADKTDKNAQTLRIAMVIYPGMTLLDFAAPFEIFARLPNAMVKIVAQTTDQVVTDTGFHVVPGYTFDTAGAVDLLFIPGGEKQGPQFANQALLGYLRKAAANARYVTSVCTGALLLGAAGLLKGYRATTHWMYVDQLPLFGAIPQQERVVTDRNRITGAGVTSGMDFALAVAAALYGDDFAKCMMLGAEYNPEPPFPGNGSPTTAEPAILNRVNKLAAQGIASRQELILAAANRLKSAAFQ